MLFELSRAAAEQQFVDGTASGGVAPIDCSAVRVRVAAAVHSDVRESCLVRTGVAANLSQSSLRHRRSGIAANCCVGLSVSSGGHVPARAASQFVVCVCRTIQPTRRRPESESQRRVDRVHRRSDRDRLLLRRATVRSARHRLDRRESDSVRECVPPAGLRRVCNNVPTAAGALLRLTRARAYRVGLSSRDRMRRCAPTGGRGWRGRDKERGSVRRASER